MRRDVITAYVEKLLGAQTGSDRVVPDGDGDYPVRLGGALSYVRLTGETDPDVQVFSVALQEVLVETNLVGESVDPLGFRTACEAVAQVAGKVGPTLAKKYGGRVIDAAGDYAPQTGMYL